MTQTLRHKAGSAAKTAAKAPAKGFRALFDRYGWFAACLLCGGLLLSAVWLVPEDSFQHPLIVAAGLGYASTYLLLLATRLMRIYAGHRFLLEIILAGVSLVATFAVFALCYMSLGVLDSTVSPQQIGHDFWYCLYLSVVTFTTLGYGDYTPVGIGRFLACLQALTGYVTLGLVASTAASLLQSAAKHRLDGGGTDAMEDRFGDSSTSSD